MSRPRAPIPEGYARKTISLPQSLANRLQSYLDDSPGLTMSAFITELIEKKFSTKKGRKAKK